MPSTIGSAQSIVVKTGRRMHTEDRFIAVGPFEASRWGPSSVIEC